MSKVRLADLLNRNDELEGVDQGILNGESSNPLEMLTAIRKKKQQEYLEKENPESIPLHKRAKASTERASFGDAGNRQADLNYTERQINEANPGNERSMYQRSGNLDENGQAVDSMTSVARSFIDNTKRNAKKGLGDFIGGWGDIFQVAGAGIGTAIDMADPDKLTFDGNMLSEAYKAFGNNMAEKGGISGAMQDAGEEMSKANESYIPEEIQNPEFKLSTFLNPEFWSTHGGQFLPQLTEILATVGASALVKKGVQVGVKAGIKDILLENAERIAVKNVAASSFTQGVKSGVKEAAEGANKSWWRKNVLGEVATTTTGRYAGSAGTNTVKGSGSGLLGRIATDEGKLTKGFGDLVQGVSGGAMTNVTVSLRNAGEVFNTYKNMYQTDENGNTILDEEGNPVPMFTNEQLGEMAADTFAVNSQYMLADMLSWGMTYGKGWNYLGSYGKKGLAAVGKNTIGVVAPQLFSKMTTPVLSNIAKLGGKAVAEGFEESIQETYEEWSKMKAYHDVHGSLEGYQGAKLTQNHDMSDGPISGFGGLSMGFIDFWKSKDSEAIRTISAGLGAMAGGGFNVTTLLDRQANDVYKMQNRAENLKQIFEKGTDGRHWQDRHIMGQMSELVMENKGGAFQDFVQDLYNDGKIDDDDVVRYANIYDKISGEYDKIKDLKIPGKKAYMLNTANEVLFQNKIQEATDIYQKNRDEFQNLLSNVEPEQQTETLKKEVAQKMKREEKIFEAKIAPLAKNLMIAKQNKTNLLLDKKAESIDYDINVSYDEAGNPDVQYIEKQRPVQNEESESNEITPEDQRDLTPDEKYDEMLKNAGKQASELATKATGAVKGFVKKILGFANNEEDENAEVKPEEAPAEGAGIVEQTDGAIEALANSFSSPEEIDSEILANEEALSKIEEDPENEEASALAKEESEKLIKRNEDLKKAKEFKINPVTSNAPSSTEPQPASSNPKIIETDEEYNFSKKDKNEFKKKGTVGSHVIGFIADKVNADEKLSDEESEVYEAFKSEVEEEAKKQVSEMEKMLEDPDIDEETKSFISETLLSTRKKQISNKKKISNADERPDFANDDDDDWTRERFSREALETAAKNLKSKLSSVKNAGTKNLNIISRSVNAIKNLFSKPRDLDFGNNEFDKYSQSIQISYALQQMYPNQNMNVYAVESIQRTVGVPAFGYTLAGQIYIDENVWNQDKVFMHEMAHIYYSLNKELPVVKTMVSYALQNKPLVDKILSDYDDQIQYRTNIIDENGEPIIATKREIIGKIYDALSPEQINSWLEKQIENNLLTEIPLAEQEIIVDELFAATLQGPASDKYDKFFNERIEEEPKRRFLTRKFWGKVKETGERFGDKGQRKVFFESLATEDQQAYSDSLKGVLEGFKGTQLSTDISLAGRASVIAKENLNISQHLDSIDGEIDQERSKLLNGLLRSQFMEKNNINIEDLVDSVAFDQIFNTDRLQYTNKLSPIVKGFASVYNKGVSVSNKMRNGRWRQLEYIDAERLRYHLISTARAAHSGPDFIRLLENTEFDEVSKFMTWMNKSRDDKNTILQTLWWHEQNTSDITSIRTFIDEKGNASLEHNLNNREITLQENIIDKIVQPFIPQRRNESANNQIRYDNLNNSARKIISGDFTNADLFEVFKYFTSPEMDVVGIWEANRVNINGKAVPLNLAVYNFVTGENGLKGGFGPKGYAKEHNGQPLLGISSDKEKVKSSVRTFVKALVNENRKFTANLTVLHADGNQHPSRIVDNYLTRNFKQMQKDAKRLSKEKFYQRYSRINKEGKGSRSNNLLDFVYNKLKAGRSIDLVEFGGIENDFNENKSVTLTENDSASDRLNQFIIYLKSSGKNSYLMDLGRFSDSSRAYYMEVPRADTDEIVNFKDGKFVFTGKTALNNIYNTHKSLGYEGSLNDFKNLIEESVKDSVAFIEGNLSVLKNDNSNNNPISRLVDSRGKLTIEAKLKVANFELNNIMNGTNFNEILFPSFRFDVQGENESLKRAKSGLSPMFSFPNVQVENIYVRDIVVNPGTDSKYTATDSAFYILEKHADKFRAAGGTLMPLGNSFKLLQTGVENYNENWKGKNIYNKGFATTLNDEVVAKNPQLKGVYELLKRRDQKYTEQVGKDSENLLDGSTHHLPMIVALSSNKNKLNGIPKDYDLDLMSFDMINTLTEANSTDSIDALLDKHYYEGEDFVGISGDNFGIQQVMDIDKDIVNAPIQFLKSLTTNMSISGNQDEIATLLNDIKNQTQLQIKNGFELIMKGDEVALRDFFKSLIDEDKVDQTQKDILLNDNLSLKTPYLRELVINTFANYIKQNGLKIKTPGGILREKPTLIKKQFKTSSDLNATSGSSDLNFYQQNSDGTFSPGEAVIPNRMLDGSKKKNPLRARMYFTENDLKENLRLAKREANKRGTSVGKVFDENDNHVGYYAAGDNIMATRIPSHGQPSTGIFEVIDFTGEEGNNIQVPNEFKRIIGSDNDGDQMFVQHKGNRTKEWNSIFDKIVDHYMHPVTQKEINQAIDFEDDAKQAISDVESVYGKRDKSFVIPSSSQGREIAFKDTLISKGNVGIAADLHTTLRMLASYGVNLKTGITINGKSVDRFFDSENDSITINSARLFNIILDNSKWGFADKLGINTNTINVAMFLTNLGYNLSDVAMVLNHPLMQRYSEMKNKNSGIFNRDEKEKIFDTLLKDKNLNLSKKSATNITIDTSNPGSQNQSIFDLIRFVDRVTSKELKAVGNVLSVHNTMSVNPFEIDQMLTDFNSVVNNEGIPNLIFNEDFKNNPLIENYLETLRKNREIQHKINPVYSDGVSDIYKNIIEMTGKTLSKKEHASIAQALKYFHASQLLGLNNIPKAEYQALTKANDPKNIFDRLKSYMNDLNSKIAVKNQANRMQSLTALDVSPLFTKGLNFNFGGNNKYISLNNEFHQSMIDEELRQEMIREFNEIPVDLRNDLLLYDLMKNGWSGPNSLFPMFNQGLKMMVSMNSTEPLQSSAPQLTKLRSRIIRNNPKMFSQYDNVLKYNKDGSFNIDKNIGVTAPSLMNAFAKGNPFIFRTQDATGKVKIVSFEGFTDVEIGENIAERSSTNSIDYFERLLPKIANKLYVDKAAGVSPNPNLDYITIPNVNEKSPSPTDPLKEVEAQLSNGTFKPSSDIQGRAMKSDWYNYDKTLNQNEHERVMEYPQGYEQDRKNEHYSKYVAEKQKADALKTVINDESVKKMSHEKLLQIYSSNKPLRDVLGDQFDNDKGLGFRDKFAYSEVMKPLVLELIQRDAALQSKLIQQGAEKFGVKSRPLGEDISLIDKWLMSNNISSSHPATQAVVKKMEIQYKTFLAEKSKHVQKINDATDDLYKEKFGYRVNERSFIEGVKHLWNQIFSNKEDFYNQLYGSLIVKENIVNDQGTVITNIRYKNEDEIKAGIADGSISLAQKKFYDVTKAMTDEQIKYTGANERQGYIPHTAPSTMEAFSRRGLLGVLVNSKALNEQIYDVHLNAKNPIDGKMVQGVSFKQVEDWYNALSKGDTKFKNSAEYTKLKYKAISLLKKGTNEDGSPIRYSTVETGTAIGDVFADRFSKGRSIKSTDFPSMDLNKAFNDYIHSSLFVHGNDKFSGFKAMLPVVDGLLAQLDRDENKNMSEYVEKIWKSYFLKGSKQHNLKNYKALEAVGISSDKVIDYLTKGSLIYWLGWKGLAIGGGAYAIGNILVGKYKNIVNEGGNAWVQGEKRFWLGKSGAFDIKDPFKGIRESNEILKNAGFMDINIFDDIAVEQKSGIEQTLMSLALLPMAKTERWIQGVHFLGKLNDSEWEQLKNNQPLPAGRTAQIEDDVKLSHGKGYQPTDQRMIQMYSWGRMMMQFSRWIPTNFYDKFAQEDINRYGEYYVGSYRKVFQTVQKAVDGRWSYSTFRDYRKNLDDAERRRLDAGLMGFGLSALLIGANTTFDLKSFDKLVGDEHIFADFERMSNKLVPPAISMGENFLK